MFLENTVNQQEQFGWIEVICGSMFSGKTEELIRRLKRAQFAKQKVEIFKPAVDTRYDDEMVVSHNKNEIRSTPVPVAENIRILAQGCDVVGIDEAQFFDEEIVAVCNDLANSGIRVIVAGLDMDFKGNPFGPMPALMATAEYVTKVHAVCTRTGNLAHYSFRKSDDKRLVMLGETEEYEPLSRAAYFKAIRENMEVKDVEIVNKQKTIINKLNLNLTHIISFCKGVFHGNSTEFTASHISIDSRSLQNGSNTLFFAIKGQNHDAHLYLEELIAKGVRYFVVEYIPEDLYEKANFIIVENSLKALQQTAIGYRKQFDFPFVGITGSNGKTIVKEWLNFLLSPNHLIVRNPKSYNSQVGVPLSILAIEGNYDLGIFEAGISLPNEMINLEHIIQPKYGILTNIGSVHDEGFANRESKIKEKIKLFENCSDIFLEKNTEIEVLLPENSQKHTWSFTDESANLFVSKKNESGKTELTFKNASNTFSVNIPFSDENSIENVITCVNFMLFLGEEIAFIQNRVTELYPVELRLQAKKGINNCLIIDDSYSVDYQSLKIALDFLEQQKLHDKKTIVLSDIFTSSIATETLYNQVKQLLSKNKIERIITIGETIGKQLNDLPNVISFATTQEFLQQFNTQSFQNETILVKGARGFNFHEIVVLLEEKNHETILEINLDAISHNLNFYKSKLKPETKIMVMVKAFGYGNGGYEIAKLLEHHKVDYLGVAFADEGIELRKAGITTPIMVLNPENSSFRAMIAYNLEPEIYSITGLQAFLKIAQHQNISHYPIHIKLDTGMHRLGFEPHLISELCSLLKNNNFVKVKSVFSHLSASDDLQFDDFTKLQFQRFDAMYSELEKVLPSKPIRHILNTSGIFNYSEKQMEMVRLGIGLYGIGNSEQELKVLENVSTLKTIISQIREVSPEESIGYSRRFRVKQKMKVATIPIGYADGIRRAWGNEKGFVTINNQKAIILGSICMDMMMVDVTNISCKTGDEVIVFGKNTKVTEMASVIGTIPYEILTGISQRVKRIFTKINKLFEILYIRYTKTKTNP